MFPLSYELSKTINIENNTRDTKEIDNNQNMYPWLHALFNLAVKMLSEYFISSPMTHRIEAKDKYSVVGMVFVTLVLE